MERLGQGKGPELSALLNEWHIEGGFHTGFFSVGLGCCWQPLGAKKRGEDFGES